VTAAWHDWTESERGAVLDSYLAAVTDYARGFGGPLDGLRIAVDAGNGMSAPATPRLLDDLGGEVVTLDGSVDGHFPGRGSKPTPESLSGLGAFLAAAADAGEPFAFGIGHDGDADRIVILDADGEVVHEDTVLAILAERYVRRARAAGADGDAGTAPVVVTTPNASGRIDERVIAAGGRTERVRLGALHEGVAAVRAAGDRVAFAAEPWKHLHPDFGGWIDGVCSAAVLARLVAGEGLASLREPVTELPYRKVNVDCPDDAKAAAMTRLRDALPDAFPEADVDTEHGVRLEFGDAAWLLVRPSGTEPYLRLYAESATVDDLVASARPVVERAVEDAGRAGTADG